MEVLTHPSSGKGSLTLRCGNHSADGMLNLSGPPLAKNPEHMGAPFYLDGVAWADDIVLFSNSLANMKAMFQILVEELSALKLQIKPGSLEVMSNWSLGTRSYVLGCRRCPTQGFG